MIIDFQVNYCLPNGSTHCIGWWVKINMDIIVDALIENLIEIINEIVEEIMMEDDIKIPPPHCPRW